MDFAYLYHFFFETMEGIACLIAASLVLTTIVSIILERKTRAMYKDRGNAYEEFEEKED